MRPAVTPGFSLLEPQRTSALPVLWARSAFHGRPHHNFLCTPYWLGLRPILSRKRPARTLSFFPGTYLQTVDRFANRNPGHPQLCLRFRLSLEAWQSPAAEGPTLQTNRRCEEFSLNQLS